MKKNNLLFISLLIILALNTSAVSAADEADNAESNTENSSPTPVTTPTPPIDNQKNSSRVSPTPQASRIRALEADLIRKNLNHQVLTLEAEGSSFLVLSKPSLTSSTQGCVILLHADNEHPDWPDAIAPLRNALPEYSWCTLSIEVPDIIKRADPIKTQQTSATQGDNTEESNLPNQQIVFARIQAAIAQANNENIVPLVFLGYKTGASYALRFLAENQGLAQALILIDTESPEPTQNYDLAQSIKQIPQPILDYYIDNNASKHQFAVWRQQAANQRQDKIGDFIQLDTQPDRPNGSDSKQLLIQRVRGFLKQNTSQIDQQKALPEYQKGLFYRSP